MTDAEDATSTADPWETESSRSTMLGIGSLTGRGIMNVGVGILRGVDYLGQRRRLARVESAQNAATTRLILNAYLDLLEYQRCVS